MTLAPLAPDPALPGLEVAGDEPAMLELLRRDLRPLEPGRFDVRSCRISRIHYVRGARCTLRYTLGLVDASSGGEQRQWVTGTMRAGDPGESAWRKLRDVDLPAPDAPFAPVAYVPEAQLGLQVFPFDRRLPALAELAAGAPAALEAVVGEGEWTVEPVQYRAGRVAVLRYSGATRRFFVKLYREREDGARTHRIAQALADDGAIGVAQLIAYVPELHALVTEELPGRPLRSALDDADAVRQAARAIAAGQREVAVELPPHGAADEGAILERAGLILGWARPDLEARIGGVTREVVARLEEVAPRPTHRELRTDHVFLDGARVGLVDLDSYAAADPLLDPARLLADLAGLSRADVAHVFAEEYLRESGESRERLLVQYAGGLLKEALDCFRHVESGWPAKVGALVEEAEQALSRSAAWAG